MYNIYLKDEDLKVGNSYGVLALLNEAANENLVEFLKNLVEGVGSGYNYTTCYFWDELDEYDKEHTPKFDGLGIETENGDVIVVSSVELVYYMEKLIERIPDSEVDKNLIEKLICEFTGKYK